MRSHIIFIFVGLLLLSAIAVVPGDAVAPSSGSIDYVIESHNSSIDACTPLVNGSEASDPNRDRLGWENGCWHDTNLHINQTNGLNQTEQDAMISRTMARVEIIRQLEFREDVPVSVLTQQEYASRIANRYPDTTEPERLRENVKWEALLMIGENTDAINVQQSNIMTESTGYYDSDEERFVVVVNDSTVPNLDEKLLAHELVHALQNQHFSVTDRFDVSTFKYRWTTESMNAINGLLEGDAELVEQWYEKRCTSQWSCSSVASSSGNETPYSHVGMYLVGFQPYSDGPKFVHALYRNGGWEAVNAAYDAPPTSTEQVMRPATYPTNESTTVDFVDKSTEKWHMLEEDSPQPNYTAVGQPGITVMMLYPFFDSGRDVSPGIPLRIFINSSSGKISDSDPFRYGNNPYADGLEVDRLYPYVTNKSFETGETGYVWKFVWETKNDSREFVEGYKRVLEYYNATPVENRENTYRISESERFSDAFYLNRTGKTVYIVNAPNVNNLSHIRAGAASSATEGVFGTGTFGSFATLAVLLAVLALVGTGLLVRSRR